MAHIKLGDNLLVKETSTLNLGPTHPAAHGVFQNILELDGERIVSAQSTIGYIHRAFEKIAEHRPFYQLTPLTDRMNYCSAPINNIGWHTTMEKLLGITVPKRVDYMRVILMELSRITDHLICNSIVGVDSGAYTGFLYLMQKREDIYEIYEEICGGRLTTNIGRIGGFERDFNETAMTKIKRLLEAFPPVMRQFEGLFNRNRIFMDRCVDVTPVSAEKALSYGWTGPLLRSCGVDYDVRVAKPYCSYEEFDFEIPVGTKGDIYDRFIVRNEEMWQSLRIVQQAVEKMEKEPKGIFNANVPAYCLPPKQETYNTMEGLINHFKIIMGEIDIPTAEVYHAVEGGNGELGFYMITDGGRAPYRLRFRRPSFVNYAAYTDIAQGCMISDAILSMSSLNIIAGELDA